MLELDLIMEFLLCFLCGVLYTEFMLMEIVFAFTVNYIAFKFAFWVFEKLGIENPVIKVYEFIKKSFGGF